MKTASHQTILHWLQKSIASILPFFLASLAIHLTHKTITAKNIHKNSDSHRKVLKLRNWSCPDKVQLNPRFLTECVAWDVLRSNTQESIFLGPGPSSLVFLGWRDHICVVWLYFISQIIMNNPREGWPAKLLKHYLQHFLWFTFYIFVRHVN